ncbi:MAG TPA: cytochrome c peroxidase [Tepidisphaeraceae bacterium]|jgi:cytochrome c peroxidase|nr:cytochrome c peroxidase [Tepidisphaeraceae bacterium]
MRPWINWSRKGSIALAAGVIGIVIAGIGRPRPVAAEPADEVLPASSPAFTLGKALFNDTTLSNPAGMSCASCHSESAGFTFPDQSVNLKMGPVPGIVPGRFGFRAPPTIGYAVFLPKGPPKFDPALQAYAGGLFWDGRATDLANQATFPFQNPNEMNNLVHDLGDPESVVEAVEKGKNAALFKQAYGSNIFKKSTAEVFQDICDEIAAFESSEEVSPFSSKYDAYLAGKAQLSEHEMIGLQLVTGSYAGRPGVGKPHKFAQCTLCHGIPTDPSTGPDIWSNSCFANIGVPKNLSNPYYNMTDSKSNPAGYNAAGAGYIDLGLGAIIYPQMGLPPGNMGKGSNGKGDFLAINGTFKAPTLRNVDRRPSPTFVKCYMHNGVFKSLYDVVHFYNKRSLTNRDEAIDFTKANPYAGLKGDALFHTPEFPSPITLQNATGAVASQDAQVGHLNLTHEEENEIVLFLQTLTDGYFKP